MDIKEGINIRVIYKGVGERPNIVELPDSIRALQDSVGGAVEVNSITTDVAIISNAFALDRSLPYNCRLKGRDWYGPILFVGFDGDQFCSFPDKTAKALLLLIE